MEGIERCQQEIKEKTYGYYCQTIVLLTSLRGNRELDCAIGSRRGSSFFNPKTHVAVSKSCQHDLYAFGVLSRVHY